MAVKKTNRVVPITLGEFHVSKLKMLCRHTGLSKTGVVQRLIEQYKLPGFTEEITTLEDKV